MAGEGPKDKEQNELYGEHSAEAKGLGREVTRGKDSEVRGRKGKEGEIGRRNEGVEVKEGARRIKESFENATGREKVNKEGRI